MTGDQTGDQVTVLVADDHLPTRTSVRAALENNGFAVVGSVGTAAAAVALARSARPDVCLLDIRMPGNGIAAAHAISAAVPDSAIVMLTVSRDDADLFDAIRAGASGYLTKDIDPDRLPVALRGVLRGEAALPRSLVQRLVTEFRGREQRRLPLARGRGARLTAREWEVLELLAGGATTAEIATSMYVSPVTVRTHVSAILRKLHVPDRAAAIRLFDQRG